MRKNNSLPMLGLGLLALVTVITLVDLSKRSRTCQ